MNSHRDHGERAMHPTGPIRGAIRPPGSKSITNRHLLLAALAGGTSLLRGASFSDDALAMVEGLRALGIAIDLDPDRGQMQVLGRGGLLPADQADIDVGPAGTAMRFLAAACCLGYGRYRVDGSPRMRQRPIGPLVDGLSAIGASIGYEGESGFPPLTIVAAGLSGGTVIFRSPPSSQFLSALLMVAPLAASDVLIRIDGDLPSRPYVLLTLDAMAARGADVLASNGRYIVPARQTYSAGPVEVEPDASSATYFWAAAAITGGSVRVDGISRNSRQADVAFVDVLGRMGCVVRSDDGSITLEAPAGARLKGIDIDMNDMPDAVQTLAVVALFADGPTTIRNVANLRVKETDRIAALARELTRIGARVETADDGLTIHPADRYGPATFETYEDHRMAMSLALVGLRVEGVRLRGADCVSKSHPDYFEDLDRLVRSSS